ncbi:MAG: hypothetical protein V4556_00235 [Bacteroidota bacterium]
MYNSLIAASLFQNKSCTLPGIGKLTVHTTRAKTDFVNTQLLAPVYSISFSPIDDNAGVFNEFSAISGLLKKDLEQTGMIELDGIGILKKDDSGKIVFTPYELDPNFTPAISAERVIRQNSEHAMLVGDKETTNVVMTEYFIEDEVKKDYWWVWAIVLFLLGIGAIAFHIMQHGNIIGNSHVLGS